MNVTCRRLKDIAVANEDYDEAKRLKSRLDTLRSIGAKLAALESKKRAAVEEEDYDLAKTLKEEIVQTRREIQFDGNDPNERSIGDTTNKRSITRTYNGAPIGSIEESNLDTSIAALPHKQGDRCQIYW